MSRIGAAMRLGAALAVLALAGCASAPPSEKFAELRYSHLPPINLRAGAIRTDLAYRPPARPPNVDHRFPTPPAEAAQQWARDRLHAMGGPNIVRVTVATASVVEVPLKREGGLTGLFTTEQSERYDGTLEMRIDMMAPDGRRLATVTSKATRSTTVAENITLAERERVWFRLTEAMMNDLNASLERQIKHYFADWIVR